MRRLPSGAANESAVLRRISFSVTKSAGSGLKEDEDGDRGRSTSEAVFLNCESLGTESKRGREL